MDAVKVMGFRVVIILVIGLLVLPVIQKKFHLFNSMDLQGYIPPSKPAEHTFENWFAGTYQHQFEENVKDSIGFHHDLIRLYNELDFRLFGELHAAKIILGKQDYPFGQQMIDTWTGKEYLGQAYIKDKVRKLKILQEKLWVEKDIFLLFIIAPDKANFYPQYIPNRFQKQKKLFSNYSVYQEELHEQDVKFIDFNRFLRELNKDSPHVLFPKIGSHWSMYGAVLAADSLVRYLESETGRVFPDLVIDSLEKDNHPRGNDDDISKTLNTIWEIPHEPLTYAFSHFETDSTADTSRALFIGDSFYWQWHSQGLIKGIFGNEDFWYYCSDVYPQQTLGSTDAWNIKISDAVKDIQVIIMLQGMAGTGELGYGFVDRAYEEFTTGDPQIMKYVKGIQSDSVWLAQMKKKSVDWGIPLNMAIVRDAIYMRNSEFKKNP